MKKQHKLTLIITGWTIAIISGVLAELIGFFMLAVIAFLSTIGSVLATGVYIAERWDSYE